MFPLVPILYVEGLICNNGAEQKARLADLIRDVALTCAEATSIAVRHILNVAVPFASDGLLQAIASPYLFHLRTFLLKVAVSGGDALAL